MSEFFYAQKVLRAGPISTMDERLDDSIGGIAFERSDGRRLSEHFDTSNVDALLVLHRGTVAYERCKTMHPFDNHN